jgi:hypothetical protein
LGHTMGKASIYFIFVKLIKVEWVHGRKNYEY